MNTVDGREGGCKVVEASLSYQLHAPSRTLPAIFYYLIHSFLRRRVPSLGADNWMFKSRYESALPATTVPDIVASYLEMNLKVIYRYMHRCGKQLLKNKCTHSVRLMSSKTSGYAVRYTIRTV